MLLPNYVGPNFLGALLIAGAGLVGGSLAWQRRRTGAGARTTASRSWVMQVLLALVIVGSVVLVGFAALIALLLATGV
jgi:hypothetical protein